MPHCRYKDWLLYRNSDEVPVAPHQGDASSSPIVLNIPARTLSAKDKLAVTTLYINRISKNDIPQQVVRLSCLYADGQSATVRIRPHAKKTQQLSVDYRNTIGSDAHRLFTGMLIAPNASFGLIATKN